MYNRYNVNPTQAKMLSAFIQSVNIYEALGTDLGILGYSSEHERQKLFEL